MGAADPNTAGFTLPISYTPVPKWLAGVLGLSYPAMCRALFRIYMGNNLYATTCPDVDFVSATSTMQSTTGTLALVGTGAASVKPAIPRFVGEQLQAPDTITITKSGAYCILKVGAYTEGVPYYTEQDGSVRINWPAWLPNHGAIKGSTIPVVWTYPVEEVDRILRKNAATNDFLDLYGLSDVYYAEDTAEGRICTVVKAILTHVNYFA